MTFSLPAAMSSFGDAERVRHLRAAGKTYAVWTWPVKGDLRQMAYRERTTAITQQGNIPVDGVDASEKILDIGFQAIVSFHVIEISNDVVAVVYEDSSRRIFGFTFQASTGSILSAPVQVSAESSSPSQIPLTLNMARFYIKGADVFVKPTSGTEVKIIDMSQFDILSIDLHRSTAALKSLYIGSHILSRDLVLPLSADANTILVYDMSSQSLTVTEATPPGTVSYWSFDDTDYVSTQIRDIVGVNHGTLTGGTAPVSVAGKVGQARSFQAGSGYYNIGDPANLNITGSMSLAFWIKPDNFNQRTNPYDKAYAGEGTVTVETDGSLSYRYGSAGDNTNPYNEYGSVEPIALGGWTHCAVVRDLTERYVRWFLNGQLVRSQTAHAAAAAAGSSSISIGRGYTAQPLNAALDDMVVANQAWSAQAVAALYAKGQTGQRPTASGTGLATVLTDVSGNQRHGVLTSMAVATARGRVPVSRYTTLATQVASSRVSFAVPAAMTIEVRIVPKGFDPVVRDLFSLYVPPNSSGTRLPGCVWFRLLPDMSLVFGFETTTKSVELRQNGGQRLDFRRDNHVAVVHTFGSGGNSLILVNGSSVPTRWTSDSTGNEVPAVLTAAATIALASGDELLGLRVSNVARTTEQIRTYLRGRS